MPRYRSKKNHDVIINVPNVRILFTDEGTMEVDRDNVYNLQEYEPYEVDGDYSNVSAKKNPKDKIW